MIEGAHPAPIPEDEFDRLLSLAKLRILDTDPDPAFDGLTKLAQERFGVSTSLVSLVDAERQWFKSRQGLDASETHRDVAFCAHAILDDAIFEVPDTAEDPRFATNPLVTGPPHIRFYAGRPLKNPDGQRIGTLCIIDPEPREMTSADREALAALGLAAEGLLRARWLATAAEQDRHHLDQMLRALAHDLKVPVRHASQCLSLLEPVIPTDDDSRQLWGITTKAMDRMGRQMAGLLHLSRGLQGGDLSLVDTESACRNAWTELGPPGATFVSKGLPEVPSREPGISEVLYRLIENAVQHSGRPEPTVTVGATATAGGWRFTVHDDGRGLPPDTDDFVFLPLSRIASDDSDSCGIGLAVVRTLVEAMGGEAGFEPRIEGGGTTAWFTWPALGAQR